MMAMCRDAWALLGMPGNSPSLVFIQEILLAITAKKLRSQVWKWEILWSTPKLMNFYSIPGLILKNLTTLLLNLEALLEALNTPFLGHIGRHNTQKNMFRAKLTKLA